MKEAEWFNRRNMGRFAAVLRSPTIYDIGNLLLLRGDIHRLLDQLKWVIYPKAFSVGSALETRLVFHHLDAVPQLRMLYHNVPLRETAGLRLEYLLSRFALTIFEGLGPFLWCQVGRHLIKTPAGAEEAKSEFFTGFDIARNHPAPGTRSRKSNSSSPTKRSRRESESPTKTAEMDSTSSGFNHKKRRRSSSDPGQDSANPNSAKRTRPNFGLPDIPCSCTHQEEPLTPTSADGKSVDAEDPPWQPFKFCRARTCLARLEYERVGALRETALHAERAKSGTEDWWTGITAWWEQRLRQGGGISPRSIRKWKWIEGAEYEEGELDFLREETTEPRWWL